MKFYVIFRQGLLTQVSLVLYNNISTEILHKQNYNVIQYYAAADYPSYLTQPMETVF